MGTTLKHKMVQLTPERRARIEAEADRLHAEYQKLKDLRREKVSGILCLRGAAPTRRSRRRNGRSVETCHALDVITPPEDYV
jgi:hypothetical protein